MPPAACSRLCIKDSARLGAFARNYWSSVKSAFIIVSAK